MAIFDTMNFVPCDLNTVCFGTAASMGAFLLGAGTEGKRRSLPNSRIMIHQPWGGAQGTAQDIEIQANEIKRNKEVLSEILSRHSGQPEGRITDDSHLDFFMSSREAQEYGLVDQVIETLKPAAEVS